MNISLNHTWRPDNQPTFARSAKCAIFEMKAGLFILQRALNKGAKMRRHLDFDLPTTDQFAMKSQPEHWLLRVMNFPTTDYHVKHYQLEIPTTDDTSHWNIPVPIGVWLGTMLSETPASSLRSESFPLGTPSCLSFFFGRRLFRRKHNFAT